MKYFYTGKQIKALIGMNIKTVHTETAKHAYKAIMDNYGNVTEESHYYHAGRGHWLKVKNGSDVTGHRKFTTDMLKEHVELEKRKKEKTVKAKNSPVVKTIPNKSGFTHMEPAFKKGIKSRSTGNAWEKAMHERDKKAEKIRKQDKKNKEQLEENGYKAQAKNIVGEMQKQKSDKDSRIAGQDKVRQWALTKEAQNITPKASFLVYDFLTGRYENTLNDLEKGKVTKKQVYRVLTKIAKTGALPKATVSNYAKRVKAFNVTEKPKLSSKLSGLKAPGKPIKRGGKTALKGSNKPVLKTIEKPKKTSWKAEINLDEWTGTYLKKGLGLKTVTKTNTPPNYKKGFTAISNSDTKFTIYIYKPHNNVGIKDGFTLNHWDGKQRQAVNIDYDSKGQTLKDIKQFINKYDKNQKLTADNLKSQAKPTPRAKKTLIKNKQKPVTKSIPAKVKPMYKGFMVTGNTYPVKDLIKSVGGKWNKDYEAWIVPAQKISAKKINELKKTKGLKIRALKTDENVFRRLAEAERLDLRAEKAEKKVGKWSNQADRLEKEAKARMEISDQKTRYIPFGQPVMVDHYSAQSHKRALAQAQNYTVSAFKKMDESGALADKASSLSSHMEYIKDPNQMKGRLVKLEKELKYWQNQLKNNDKKVEYYKKNGDKEDVQRMQNNVGYIRKQIENKKQDIESIKARLPKEALQPATTGVNIKQLSGATLKKLLGAELAKMTTHSTNLSGGYFAILVRKNLKTWDGLTLVGSHNHDNIIISLRAESNDNGKWDKQIIPKENYKEYDINKTLQAIKRVWVENV